MDRIDKIFLDIEKRIGNKAKKNIYTKGMWAMKKVTLYGLD